MFVRTVYATGDPAKLDQALDGLRAEAVGLLAAQPGYRGYGLFANRELGIVTMGSWWESAQAERDSDAQLKQRRAELLQPFAGTVTTDTWEAVVAARPAQAGPGAWFRLTKFDFDRADADRIAAAYREGALPAMQKVDGFLGGSMLLNSEDERGSVGGLFADKAALVASRGAVAQARAKAVAAGGVTLRSLEEFEVVLLDLPQHG
ncbi:antibiotic biosynthesis monooxygenase [Kitasatospora sp. NPDC056181]|uniref:antibiotic biosynthesis monooxygenase n=1 Tax=Kitasatospora sp. NPDC056181 TaxID=3345737 RepID=UPI0035DB431F